MPGTSPIQLGSAVSGWTFEAASSVEESASGIQTCTVQALWPVGSTVLSNLPAAGASASVITSYIPSSFLLDYTEAGPSVDFIEGTVARVKFKFKRQDPNRIGRTFAIVESDSVINYKSQLNDNYLQFIGYIGGTNSGQSSQSAFGSFGFPEPVVTVKYNSTIQPGIGTGGFGQIYALPGSANTTGFPPAGTISYPISIPVGPGASVTYYDPNTGTIVTIGPVTVSTTFNFVAEYRPNVLGWQLEKIRSTAIAGGAFYDVQEDWRIYYLLPTGAILVGSIPPVPP